MNIKETIKIYNEMCNEILYAFQAKNGLNNGYWIADRYGEVADFGGMYFTNMSDMIDDLTMPEASENKYIDYHELSVRATSLDLSYPIYRNWLKGAKCISLAEIEELEKKREEFKKLIDEFKEKSSKI